MAGSPSAVESGIPMQERLQKIIARAGVTSRRKAEELISTGRVSVNGTVITELGEKADAHRDTIKVDGKPLKTEGPAQYWLLYKPREVVTTLSDPEGRPSIQEFLRGMRQRLFPVGRLDYHSEGLLLLTNDGELAHKVMHASSHLAKVYLVKVSGRPEEEQLERLRQGVFIDGRRTARAEIRRLLTAESPSRRRGSSDNPWLEVTLIEGRNQQIRKMFATIDHPVEKLKRVSIGPLKVGAMKPGEMRPLSAAELTKLRRELEEGATAGERPAPPRRGVARREERGAARIQKSPRRMRDEAPAEKRRTQRAGASRALPKLPERFEEPKRKALDFDVEVNAESGFDFDRDFNREYDGQREERQPRGRRPQVRPELRPEARRGARPGGRPGARHGSRPGERPGGRPGARKGPGSPRSEERRTFRPDDRREGRREERRPTQPTTRGGSERSPRTSGRGGHSGTEVRGGRTPLRGGAAAPGGSGKKSFAPKRTGGKGGNGGGRSGGGFSGRRGPETSNRGAARRSPRGRS